MFSEVQPLENACLKKSRQHMTDLFEMLWNRGFISHDNMARLQNILDRARKKDLVKMATEYAKCIGNVVYYYPAFEFPENGYIIFFKVHIGGINFDILTVWEVYIQPLFCSWKHYGHIPAYICPSVHASLLFSIAGSL